MSTIEDQFNSIMYMLSEKKEGSDIYPKDFAMEYSLFKSLIDEMEKDNLLNRGHWIIEGNGYIFMGLTFKGISFVQNNDKKQYAKIDKTEINNHYNVNIGRDNNGQIAFGDNNNFSSEFDKKFTELIQGIYTSQLADKNKIIEELEKVRSNKVALQSSLGHLLTRGAEVSSLVSMITGILPLLAS